MNGKPSSPVLRGLGASNGARLLDQVLFAEILLDVRFARLSGLAPDWPANPGIGRFVWQLLFVVLTWMGQSDLA